MPVLNEDTLVLMCLIEQDEALHDDCYRIATRTLEQHPPRGNIQDGIGKVATSARAELAETLRTLIRYSGTEAIRDHLRQGRIDWRDLAREFIAGVLCVGQEQRQG